MDGTNTEQFELIELNKRLGEAERTRDEKYLRDALSDALRFRRANGTIVDKAIFLDDLMKPGNTFDKLESDQVVVNVYGNLAIVTLRVQVEGMRCGNKLEGSFRNIRIFLKEPNKNPQWVLHSWFNTRIVE